MIRLSEMKANWEEWFLRDITNMAVEADAKMLFSLTNIFDGTNQTFINVNNIYTFAGHIAKYPIVIFDCLTVKR